MSSADDERFDEATRSLELERARYAELFELAPVGYLVTDPDGVVHEANLGAAELLGTEPRALIGKPLVVFVPLDARRDFREHLLHVAASRETHRWQLELHARDHARVIVEVIMAPGLGDVAQDSLRWVLQDVTQTFTAEERARRAASEAEERFLERTAEVERQHALLEAVLENIPAGFAVVDDDANVLLANSEALRMFGVEDAAGLHGWHLREAYRLDGTDVTPEERPIARTLRTGEVVRGEMLELVIGGRHAIVEISTAPIVSPTGERSGAVSVFRDVTVRERAERAERDFVTNAAHELQSPLAAIVSAVEVLQAGAKDGPERDVFLGHIQREADRLARLVRALLILARSQVGLEAPRDELVALCPLLQSIGEGLQRSSSVELEIDCPEDLAVLTNRELVEQAVVNLAENAAKSTKSGRIVLSAKELSGRAVEIAVTDTGAGIPAAHRQRVFDRFYRADPNGGQGFGLGLSIVRAVVDALGGELELDSTSGAGTIVRLRLLSAASMVKS